jgi:hypothetical protein
MPTSMESFTQNGARVAWERRYSFFWFALVIEIVLGVALGLMATGSRQAFDTHTYAGQALELAFGNGSWLTSGAHNYLYPGFLAVLHALGLWNAGDDLAVGGGGRLAVGVAQVALLYLAVFTLMAILSRCLRIRFVTVGIVVCGIAILPAAAWSGYWLSESVAAPMLLLVIALWVLTCYRVFLRPDAMSTITIVFILGLASGSAWMTRPALIWVPAVVGFLAGMVILASMLLLRTWRRDLGKSPPSVLRAMSLVGAFLVGAVLALVPQLAFDNSVDHLLRLKLAGGQAQLSSNIWRYATNLSSCGPAGLVFSPLPPGTAPLAHGHNAAAGSPMWGLTAMAAHLVSGWDPLPSPTYATSLTMMPWVLVTMVSGFVCAAPLFAGSWLVGEMRRLRAGCRLGDELPVDMLRLAFAASIAGVLVFFGVTQLQLLRTATEFRFNLMGWLSAAACMVFLIAAGWLSRRRLVLYVGVGVTISAVVLIVGQMTLDYSPYWLGCR